MCLRYIEVIRSLPQTNLILIMEWLIGMGNSRTDSNVCDIFFEILSEILLEGDSRNHI
jgi:hypothetical protein